MERCFHAKLLRFMHAEVCPYPGTPTQRKARTLTVICTGHSSLQVVVEVDVISPIQIAGQTETLS